jgi:predicted Zn finger-like uncharacterized protein
MTIECPHCGADYPIDAKQTAGRSRLNGHCNYCNSSFVINAQHSPAHLPAKQIAAIAVIEGPARGQVFRLRQPRTVLGRAGADIVLRDPEVSRRHCVIEIRGATAMLVDLDTTNGTYVHGKRIETYKLKHLTKFRVGASALVFTVTNKKADQSTAPATLVTPHSRLLFR